MVLGAIVLTLVQAGIGMDVNLYVTVPARHPGAHPASYLSGSVHSVGWAIAHGTPSLAVHASLGLALVIVVVAIAVRDAAAAALPVIAWAILGALLVIGAGFNGASFLDFNDNLSSLIMTLLALGAIACYAIALFLLPATPQEAGRPGISGT